MKYKKSLVGHAAYKMSKRTTNIYAVHVMMYYSQLSVDGTWSYLQNLFEFVPSRKGKSIGLRRLVGIKATALVILKFIANNDY